MSEDNEKRKSTRNFNLNKVSSRNFNLEKDFIESVKMKKTMPVLYNSGKYESLNIFDKLYTGAESQIVTMNSPQISRTLI